VGVRYSASTWQQPLRPPTPAGLAVLDSIAGRVLALGGGRLRVAIDGRTAAGKTSFGHQLAERVGRSGRPVLRACLDDFKRPWRERHLYDRESGEGYYRNAFDYDGLVELLLDPADPSTCALCGIDPLTQVDHSTELSPVAADAVLIVDGVFAFRPEINDYWDFRIWLDVDPETSIERGARRDQSWAGSEAEAVHRLRYLPAERCYLAEVDPRSVADVGIDNTVFEQPEFLWS
jgi:uridine kinase